MEIQNQSKTYALCSSPANRKIAAQIEADGGRVVRFPQLETRQSALDDEQSALLERLGEFDWLIFSDVFAADYFLARLADAGADFFALDRLCVCALGEAVADRLRFAQVHADVIPVSVSTDATVSALAAYIGEPEIGTNRFLFIKRFETTESEIEIALKETGAPVRRLEIYLAESVEAASGENARLKAMFAGGAIDEFVFAAPADFLALEAIAARDLLEEVLRETKITAIDEVTLQFLRENGFSHARFFAANKKG